MMGSDFRGDQIGAAAAAAQMLMQLAIFCCLMLDQPNTRTPIMRNRWTGIAMVLIPVLVVVVLIRNWMIVVALVGVAVEAMELGQPVSQYRHEDSIFFGVDPNLGRRCDRFAQSATAAMIPLFALLFATVRAALAPIIVKRHVVVVFSLLALTGIYPCWLYSIGLRAFSPPFEDASLLRPWDVMLCGLLAATLVAAYCAMRFSFRWGQVIEFEQRRQFAHRYASTQVLLVFASLAWLIPWDRTWWDNFGMEWYGVTLSPFVSPDRYIAMAIVFVAASRLIAGLAGKRGHQQRRYVELDLRKFGLLLASGTGLLLLGAPAVTWFVYSLVRISLKLNFSV